MEKLLGWEDARKEKGGWEPYFHPSRSNRNKLLVHTYKANTTQRAYPKLDKFLQNYKHKIHVFADVGAANSAGAPMAVEAKDILAPNTRVLAVDIFKSPIQLHWQGVEEINLAIQRKPLPIQCDAIRFAQTAHNMSKEAFVKALGNIWLSLKPGGFLLGATEYNNDARDLLAQQHHQFVLMKVPKSARHPLGFVEIFPNELKEY